MTWNLPIGRPNCSRSLAYCTDRSTACCSAPAISSERASAPRARTAEGEGPGRSEPGVGWVPATSAQGSPA